jgi:hypothetical protein
MVMFQRTERSPGWSVFKRSAREWTIAWVDFGLFYIFNKSTPAICNILYLPKVLKLAQKNFDQATASSCTATSIIHIEITKSYSTDSFLQALRRFQCAHGTLAKIISNIGEQL